ncbi:MAG: hypothetical protein LCH57_02770 [Proteobacteria bacterium]|uniref:hypothetical protein n=1 Tax=Brevundimonas sp. TaxID=1871086 RepID=UPI001ACBDE99|nr:hypothetical protein [Brevundimonas sp.]MBN9465047.1 hypothetical protein [Brevundimonas sp.]MCA0366972.1 hypothetical protein [Pseudomonadota bacterium]
MAVVTTFERYPKRTFKQQPTQVIGFYGTFGDGSYRVLQIDTLGSENREKPKKQSQTLQLNATSAKELYDILGREFGFSS